jgi:adenine-specific DNA-methyltransferase
MQKIIYSDNWKDGKPQDKEGISQMFKYISLDSYEDTLNNLVVNPKAEALALPGFKEEYLLHYMLNQETQESQLDIDQFKHPFDYKLAISTGIVGETRSTNVDLVETFNYLIGLQVENIRYEDQLLIVRGQTRLHDEKVMVIWRDGECEIPDALQSTFVEYEKVYINGDVDIDADNLYLTEKTFKEQMFKEI